MRRPALENISRRGALALRQKRKSSPNELSLVCIYPQVHAQPSRNPGRDGDGRRQKRWPARSQPREDTSQAGHPLALLLCQARQTLFRSDRIHPFPPCYQLRTLQSTTVPPAPPSTARCARPQFSPRPRGCRNARAGAAARGGWRHPFPAFRAQKQPDRSASSPPRRPLSAAPSARAL